MAGLFGFRKKSITIALAGTDIPIYLAADTELVLKILPSTTAAAAALVLRSHVRRCWGGWGGLWCGAWPTLTHTRTLAAQPRNDQHTHTRTHTHPHAGGHQE